MKDLLVDLLLVGLSAAGLHHHMQHPCGVHAASNVLISQLLLTALVAFEARWPCPSRSRRWLLNGLTAGTWLVSLRVSMYAASTAHDADAVRPAFANGSAYLVFAITSLLQMVLTRRLVPAWACYALSVMHALMFYRAAELVCASTGSCTHMHRLLLLLAAQAAALAPYTLLAKVFELQGMPGFSVVAHTPRLSSYVPVSSCTCSDTSEQVHNAEKQPGQHPTPSGSGMQSTAAALAMSQRGMQSNLSRSTRGVAARHLHPTPRANMSQGTRSLTDMVQSIRNSPYQSRLGRAYQVQLKLATDFTPASLPANMAQHMQDALNNIGGPTLHVSELSVRSGCIMVSISVNSLPPPQLADSLSAADSMARRRFESTPAHFLAAVFLPKLQQLLTSASHGSGSNGSSSGVDVVAKEDAKVAKANTPTTVPCKQALVQVGQQLLLATLGPDTDSWHLEPMPIPGLDDTPISGAPSLGVSVASHARLMRAQTQAEASCMLESQRDSMWFLDGGMLGMELGIDIQLWGLTKLDEVEGWAPPAAGQHDVGRSSSNSSSDAASSITNSSIGSWPSWTDAEISASGSVKTGAGRSMKLLARIGGDYLVTHVQRVLRPTGSSNATVQVVIDLPLSYLVRHHPGGVPSSLVLLSLELWEGEVFLSSSPLISLPQAVTSGAGLNSSAWWWGASEGVVTAAMTEIEALASAIMSSASDLSQPADPMPSYVAFMKDLREWLACVQHIAMAAQLCTAPAAGMSGADAQLTQQLTQLQLAQELGNNLLAHASHVGMVGVQNMLAQQLRSVVQAAKLQLPATGGGCTTCGSSSMAHGKAWLRGVRDVVMGYPCSMCEARYKQQLGEQLGHSQALASLACVLYGVGTAVRSTHDVREVVVILPWTLMHAAAALGWLQGMPCGSLYWAAYAYAWRILVHTASAASWVRAPSHVSLRLFRAQPWAATHMIFALIEQVQASAVLPAVRVAQITLLGDLPCALACGVREGGGPAGLLALVAPLVLVGLARLLLDACIRRLLRSSSSGSSSQSTTKGVHADAGAAASMMGRGL